MNLRRYMVSMAAAIMICAVFIANPMTVWAQGSGNVAVVPYWVNVSTVNTSLTFSGTTANCQANVYALSGTSSISATIRLERKVGSTYETVKTWTASSTSSTLSFSGNTAVTQGYTYRLTITATVARNGTTETVSNSSENSL